MNLASAYIKAVASRYESRAAQILAREGSPVERAVFTVAARLYIDAAKAYRGNRCADAGYQVDAAEALLEHAGEIGTRFADQIVGGKA